MSDEEEHDDPEEPAEESEQNDEEQPEIDDEEMADLSGLADEVEEESGGGVDTDEEEETDADTDDGDEGELPSPDDPGSGPGESWGDLYVGTLTTVSNAIIEEYGDGDTIDEDLARQQHLDEYFDDWMKSRGKREDMPPEQALIISTSMFLITVVGTKTDLVGELLGEVEI